MAIIGTDASSMKAAFTSEKLYSMPSFYIAAVLLGIAVLIDVVVMPIVSRNNKLQIQELTGGLWKRPWWSY